MGSFSSYIRAERQPSFAKDVVKNEIHNIKIKYLNPYLNSKYEPAARSMAQYIGSRCCRTRIQRVLRNLASFVGIPYFLTKVAFSSGRGNTHDRKMVDGVLIGDRPEFECPPELQSLNISVFAGNYQRPDWPGFLMVFSRLWKVRCLSPEVYLKAIREIGTFAAAFELFNPSFFITFREFDHSSSLVTEYIHSKNVKIFNVMHGDKAFTERDSFYTFDSFYVWHEGYAEIARQSEALVNNYIVYTPNRFNAGVLSEDSVRDDVLLLLPGYDISEEEQKHLLFALESLLQEGFRVRVRAHPRYRNNPSLQACLKRLPAIVSNPGEERGIDAIRAADVVVGYNSTMLLEALAAGKKVICLRDDMLKQIEPYHPYYGGSGIIRVNPSEFASMAPVLCRKAP